MSENRIIIAFSLSPPSFLFRYTPTRHTAKEESTHLQLPAAEGSGTFQPLRLIPIESESTAGSQVGSWTAAAVIDRPPSRLTGTLDLQLRASTLGAPSDLPSNNYTQPTTTSPSIAGMRAGTRTFFRQPSETRRQDRLTAS